MSWLIYIELGPDPFKITVRNEMSKARITTEHVLSSQKIQYYMRVQLFSMTTAHISSWIVYFLTIICLFL